MGSILILLCLFWKLFLFGLEINDGHVVPAYFCTSLLVAVVLHLALRIVRGTRARLLVAAAADFIFSWVVLVTMVYFRFYGQPFPLDLFMLSDTVGDIRNTVTEIFLVQDVWFILPEVILVSSLSFPRFRSRFFRKEDEENSSSGKAAWILAGSLVLGAGFLAPTGFWTMPGRMQGREGLSVLNPLFLYSVDLGRMAWRALFFPSPEERESIRRELLRIAEERRGRGGSVLPTPDGKPLGQPNIVIIQFEALMWFALGKTIDGREVTPFLNSLASRSVLLRNFYSEGYNSLDAEFPVVTSLHPLKDHHANVSFFENDFQSLPKVLKKAGYHSVFAGGHFKHFWNAARMNFGLGFDTSFFGDSMGSTTMVGHFPADRDFFATMTGALESLPRPFYASLEMSSSHHPFALYNIPLAFPPETLPGDDILWKRYFNVINYSDGELGRFLTGVASASWFSNTLFVIYGDHFVPIPTLIASSPEALATYPAEVRNEVTRLLLSHVPCFIFSPANISPGVIDKFASHVDLAPTVVSLVGIEQPPEFLGESVFTPGKGFMVNKYFWGFDGERVYGGADKVAGNFRWAFKYPGFQFVEPGPDLKERFSRLLLSERMIFNDTCHISP